MRLEQADLLDARDWGEFDYVVAHGVYAWVQDPVRDALMALFARCLAPHGVAFVSYNALPGARLRTMLREMALLHAGEEAGPGGARRPGRASSTSSSRRGREDRPDAYGAVLASELARLRRLPEPRARARRPRRAATTRSGCATSRCHASATGCAISATPSPPSCARTASRPAWTSSSTRWPAATASSGSSTPTCSRAAPFRQTLLCRADAPLDDAIDPARLARLWFRATEDAGIGDAPAADAPTRPSGSANGSTGPAAVPQLALARPRSLGFGELRDALGGADAARSPRSSGARSAPARWSSSAAPGAARRRSWASGPRRAAVARWQAARGPELTSLRHDAGAARRPARPPARPALRRHARPRGARRRRSSPRRAASCC